MSSDYKRYFPFLWADAQRKGLNKTEFMERCGMPKQSFVKYQKGQGIQAKTMVNLMEGLGMTVEALEMRSGISLSSNEKSDLSDAKWLKRYAAGIQYLKDHDQLMNEIQRKALADS